MPITMVEIIRIKRRLARSLLAKAHRWEDPSYMSFVSHNRRRVQIFTLRARAKELQRELVGLVRILKRGAGKVN